VGLLITLDLGPSKLSFQLLEWGRTRPPARGSARDVSADPDAQTAASKLVQYQKGCRKYAEELTKVLMEISAGVLLPFVSHLYLNPSP
jgi:hypothetical protein